MNQYVTGNVIRKLREKNKMTQSSLASCLSVSDKTVSKWETGKGYPDITLLEPLADVFNVTVTELITGDMVENNNLSRDMSKVKFYVCPVCGNVITSIGEAMISCHGINLPIEQAENCNEQHMINVELVEDEYYVRINHEMTKEHYISFVAMVSGDLVMIKKFYPEMTCETYVKKAGIRWIMCYCNRDGLFCYDLKKMGEI